MSNSKNPEIGNTRPKTGPQKPGFGTTCVQNRVIDDKPVHTHREAIYPTTAFTYPSAAEAVELFNDQDKGYIYSRWNNPTLESATRAITDLEVHGGDIKASGRLFASGMAAIAAVLMAHLEPGQAMLTQKQLYGGTDELMKQVLKRWGIKKIVADLNDTEAVNSILNEEKVGIVYAETPSNPMLEVVDLRALSGLTKAAGVPLAVDNTFATPYLQQPLLLGADFSVYSTTKFLNGHGSALGGAVIGSDPEAMSGRIWQQLKLLGAVPSPFDAWLLTNGIKTLELRMERHLQNARQVADYLASHEAVSAVHFLGHESHPYHELAARQMKAFGSMLSFELKGGFDAGLQLMDRVKVCVLATTLGTLDTLVQHPASMTHLPVPEEERLAAGITNGLIRMSVGIENVQDVIADLEQAMH